LSDDNDDGDDEATGEIRNGDAVVAGLWNSTDQKIVGAKSKSSCSIPDRPNTLLPFYPPTPKVRDFCVGWGCQMEQPTLAKRKSSPKFGPIVSAKCLFLRSVSLFLVLAGADSNELRQKFKDLGPPTDSVRAFTFAVAVPMDPYL
jgi:hypothetical protein